MDKDTVLPGDKEDSKVTVLPVEKEDSNDLGDFKGVSIEKLAVDHDFMNGQRIKAHEDMVKLLVKKVTEPSSSAFGKFAPGYYELPDPRKSGYYAPSIRTLKLLGFIVTDMDGLFVIKDPNCI